MSMITLEEARQALTHGTGRGVKVAVIDSGVEFSHEALNGMQLVDDIAVVNDTLQLRVVDGEGKDAYGHGTAIAEIVRRIAPDVSIGSFRVLDSALASRTAIIQEGVRQALDRGYHVLNCSFGCRGEVRYVMSYKEWVDEAYLKGRHVVAACNNFDFSVPEWPGHFPTVITVNMARAREDEFFYSPMQLVEFAAAGENIDVAWAGGSRKCVTGSSYAAPVMSGLLARMLSVYPTLRPLEAKALLHRLAAGFTPSIAGRNVPQQTS